MAQGFEFCAGSGSRVRQRLNFGAAHDVSDKGVDPDLPVEISMLVDCTVEDETNEGGGGSLPHMVHHHLWESWPVAIARLSVAIYLCIWWIHQWLMTSRCILPRMMTPFPFTLMFLLLVCLQAWTHEHLPGRYRRPWRHAYAPHCMS